eukprot:jgi/Bigna1/137902/aug1.41_g12610
MYGEEKGIDLRLFLLVLKNCDKVEADPARAAASADTDIEDEVCILSRKLVLLSIPEWFVPNPTLLSYLDVTGKDGRVGDLRCFAYDGQVDLVVTMRKCEFFCDTSSS